MSVTLTFEADGVNIFRRFSWQRASRAWADEVGPLVVSAIKAEAPVSRKSGGGRLRESIKYRRKSGFSSIAMEFGSDVSYAGYVERGTPPHIIRPRNASALRFVASSGDVVYSQLVHHPGTKANPFARNAVERMSPFIERSFRENIESQFRKG